MRAVVVGTGVMGLPTARALAEAGHDVVAIDRFGVGNPMASSSGATRIWRYAHEDRERVRLARWMDAAWRELEAHAGRPLRGRQGLIWRGENALAVLAALRAEGVAAEEIGDQRSLELFPELRPTADFATIWQPEAGIVFADLALAAEQQRFERAGGTLLVGPRVLGVEQRSGGGVVVDTDRGEHVADVAVVAAGPWAADLIGPLGVEVELRPQVSQVSYVRGPGEGWAERPALVHDFDSVAEGFYALPTPGIGYKIGQDGPVRPWDPEGLDRAPDPAQVAATSELVRREFPGFDPTIVSSDVCTWTDSADALFVLGRVGDVVIGCGDSGAGFKWLPLFGEWLGGLALGQELSGDASCFDLARFTG